MTSTPLASAPPPPRLIILGSLNIDRLWRVQNLPGRGETVLALDTRTEFGGKGANQAVAARRQGAIVDMIGAVGVDSDGKNYLNHLSQLGIGIDGVQVLEDASTGSAHVYVDAKGENQIVVHAGANARLSPPWPTRHLETRLVNCDLLLVQLECSLPAVRAALHLAAIHGVPSMLNASPVNDAFSWDIPIDTVIVNEHECAELFGFRGEDCPSLSKEARKALLEKHRVRNLVVTQGPAPTLYISAGSTLAVPTYSVVPKDTVGAGDAFAGALAVRRAEGIGWKDAIWYANVVAALSTQSSGAQSSMPTRAQVEAIHDFLGCSLNNSWRRAGSIPTGEFGDEV